MKPVAFVLPFGSSSKSLLSLLLLLILPAAVQAQFTTFTTTNGTIMITEYTGPGGDVTIPSTISGLPVTSIGMLVFEQCGGLISVTIPSGVAIGLGAFNWCTGLRWVTIGTNVTILGSVSSIGSDAFADCTSLRSVRIGDSVADIGDEAFVSCTSLTGVAIGNSVTNIGESAFNYCTNLTSITIPRSVTSIGDAAFAYCYSLTSVYFQGNAPNLGGSDVFYGYNSTTVYYLPGTTGWTSTFGGRLAVLWNPQVQTSGSSFGVRTNRFGFNITGTANIPIVVEACTNLANGGWTTLQSCTITNGSVYFSDPQWTNNPARFYRLRSP